MSIAMRLSVIVRENALSSWRAAHDVLRGFDGPTVEHVHALFAGSREARVTQRAEAGLWVGSGLDGHAPALIGDPESVARRIDEYAALGVETFVLSSGGRADEIERVAGLVAPHLRRDAVAPALRTVA